jgi:hypothetical protein
MSDFYISLLILLDWRGDSWDNRLLIVVKLEQAQGERRERG